MAAPVAIEVPLYLRVGQSEEHEVGTLSFGAGAGFYATLAEAFRTMADFLDEMEEEG